MAGSTRSSVRREGLQCYDKCGFNPSLLDEPAAKMRAPSSANDAGGLLDLHFVYPPWKRAPAIAGSHATEKIILSSGHRHLLGGASSYYSLRIQHSKQAPTCRRKPFLLYTFNKNNRRSKNKSNSVFLFRCCCCCVAVDGTEGDAQMFSAARGGALAPLLYANAALLLVRKLKYSDRAAATVAMEKGVQCCAAAYLKAAE